MPKPYRKPHITMNRKKYGQVRPVRQKKQKPKFEKPSTTELRSIYTRLKKSATWQIPDLLAEAVQWYRRLIVYLDECHNLIGTPGRKSIQRLKLDRATALQAAAYSSGRNAKVYHLQNAIRKFEDEAIARGVKVPSISGYMKKAKESAKKLDSHIAKAEKKFDSVLTTLWAAIGLDVRLGAVPALASGEDMQYDPTLDKVMYSRQALKTIKKRIRAVGFLPVALEQAMYLARSEAMRDRAKKDGLYIVDNAVWIQQIAQAQKNLCRWLASSPDAPASLVKRTAPRKKRGGGKKKQVYTEAAAILAQDTES